MSVRWTRCADLEESAARALRTGTAWSGPRFFGLNGGANRLKDVEDEQAESHSGTADAYRSRRRGSVALPRTKVQR